jgi:hypothetical protein
MIAPFTKSEEDLSLNLVDYISDDVHRGNERGKFGDVHGYVTVLIIFHIVFFGAST